MAWVSSLQSQLEKMQSTIDGKMQLTSLLKDDPKEETSPETEVEASGYADVDDVRRAVGASEACGDLLESAAKSATELKLRVADLVDGRAARQTALKNVAARIKKWKAGDDDDPKDVLSAATEELGLSARRAKDAETCAERAVDLIADPAIQAAKQHRFVLETLRDAEARLFEAKHHDELDAEAKFRGLTDLAKLRVRDAIWRLARASLLADVRLGHKRRPMGAPPRPSETTDSSGMTLRGALLALRLETLETQRETLGKARAAFSVVHTCRTKTEARAVEAKTKAKDAAKDTSKHLAGRGRRSAALKSMDPMRADRDVRRALDAFESAASRTLEGRRRVEARLAQAEKDGAALVDAATAKLAAANKRIADAEARSRDLEQQLALRGDDVVVVSKKVSSRKKTVGSSKGKDEKTRDELVLELEAAEKRVAECNAVARDALADLDRERSSRKSREFGALKSVTEQLQASRQDVRTMTRDATNLERTLEEVRAKAEKDRRDLETKLHDAEKAKATVLTAALTETEARVAEITAKASADIVHIQNDLAQVQKNADEDHQKAQDRVNRLETQLSDQARLVASLQRQLQEATSKASLAQAKLIKQRSMSADLEDPPITSRSEKKKSSAALTTTTTKARRLAVTSRAFFIIYAIALHILTYLAFFHCGIVPGGGDGGPTHTPAPPGP